MVVAVAAGWGREVAMMACERTGGRSVEVNSLYARKGCSAICQEMGRRK